MCGLTVVEARKPKSRYCGVAVRNTLPQFLSWPLGIANRLENNVFMFSYFLFRGKVCVCVCVIFIRSYVKI
jgi:hypothetical protein